MPGPRGKKFGKRLGKRSVVGTRFGGVCNPEIEQQIPDYMFNPY
jgi:hypothetical protein